MQLVSATPLSRPCLWLALAMLGQLTCVSAFAAPRSVVKGPAHPAAVAPPHTSTAAVDEAGAVDPVVEFVPAPEPSEPVEPPTPIGMSAETRTNYYTDNDNNRIVTPTVNVSAELGEHWAVAGHAAIDMMTCASVDVVSAATAKGYFQENRQEYGGSVTTRRDLLKLTLGAVHSQENDYSSATGSIAISDEFAKRNTTLSLAYSFTGSDVGRAHDPTFSRRLDSHALTASWTQVLSRSWVAQFSGFVGVLDGFQSSVYRYVHFADGTSGPEVAPDLRVRQALAAELRGSLTPQWFAGASYRLYSDSWGLLSHTGELTATYAPTDWLSLRLRDRVYQQRGSSFYQSVYDRPMRYMTIDRELGALYGNLVGLKAAIDLGGLGSTRTWQLDLKYDWMWQKFEDFRWLPERQMSMLEAGLQCAF